MLCCSCNRSNNSLSSCEVWFYTVQIFKLLDDGSRAIDSHSSLTSSVNLHLTCISKKEESLYYNNVVLSHHYPMKTVMFYTKQFSIHAICHYWRACLDILVLLTRALFALVGPSLLRGLGLTRPRHSSVLVLVMTWVTSHTAQHDCSTLRCWFCDSFCSGLNRTSDLNGSLSRHGSCSWFLQPLPYWL